MPMTARCPNASCGHVSRLIDDPLGRIFRCPRCLTKLPTAPAAAADAGWTAMVRPVLRAGAGVTSGRQAGPVRGRSVARARSRPARVGMGIEAGAWGEAGMGVGVALADGGSSEYGGGSGFGGGFDPEAPSSDDLRPGFGPDRGFELGESGELVAEPLSRAGSRASAWSAASTSRSASTAEGVSAPSVAVGSAEAGQLGRFRVLGLLGQGQHATVYRAYDPVLDRDVALKVPRPGVLRTERALERFLGEARAQARLRHPRIVPVYEAGRAGDRHYLAMALIEGHSLADRLADEGPMAPAAAASVAAELAEALAYAHALGVVHRDVKPANVRVNHRGDVYLMDFGIAYRPDSNELPAAPRHDPGHAGVRRPRAGRGRADGPPARQRSI